MKILWGNKRTALLKWNFKQWRKRRAQARERNAGTDFLPDPESSFCRPSLDEKNENGDIKAMDSS